MRATSLRSSLPLLTLAATLLAAPLAACSSSNTPEEDAGIVFDATPPPDGARPDGARPDAAMPDGAMPDASVPPAVCGNGVLEAGEQCDDENTTDGDGCDGSCRWEAYCGDGTMDGGEVCDDGNNRSGDGCRSDCLSDETCGNGIVDSSVGEVCDGSTDCAADCLSVTTCGDGATGSAEECDDGNTATWDGCDAACRDELSLVMDSLTLAGSGTGCDYSGDGRPDNRFADALGDGFGLVSDMLPEAGTDLIVLLHMLGLDDRTGASDPSLRVAWLVGEDADMDPMNNRGGMGQFLIAPDSLDAMGRPVAGFESRIMMRMLRGGPEDIDIPAGLFFPLELRRGYLSGTTEAMGGRIHRILDGLLCGAIPMGTIALLPNLTDMLPVPPPPPCDGSTDPGTMADVLVGGMTVFGFTIGGVQPDVDLDGDGLERYEVMSGPTCQGVITACIDGDGTRVPGRGCALDPRFEDGYSAALPYTAIRASIVGVAP